MSISVYIIQRSYFQRKNCGNKHLILTSQVFPKTTTLSTSLFYSSHSKEMVNVSAFQVNTASKNKPPKKIKICLTCIFLVPRYQLTNYYKFSLQTWYTFLILSSRLLSYNWTSSTKADIYIFFSPEIVCTIPSPILNYNFYNNRYTSCSEQIWKSFHFNLDLDLIPKLIFRSFTEA